MLSGRTSFHAASVATPAATFVPPAPVKNAFSETPNLQLKTGGVSRKTERGRHTTRHVELFCLGDDTFVADTPGFSSFETDQMDVLLKENLQFAFADFAAYFGQCQFHDCSHRQEPGCAIRQAMEEGKIEKTRYDSYLRLYEKASQVKLWELK